MLCQMPELPSQAVKLPRLDDNLSQFDYLIADVVIGANHVNRHYVMCEPQKTMSSRNIACATVTMTMSGRNIACATVTMTMSGRNIACAAATMTMLPPEFYRFQSHNHAAPRTPDESPWTGCFSFVLTVSEKT